jgi:hypothetical protein
MFIAEAARDCGDCKGLAHQEDNLSLRDHLASFIKCNKTGKYQTWDYGRANECKRGTRIFEELESTLDMFEFFEASKQPAMYH